MSDSLHAIMKIILFYAEFWGEELSESRLKMFTAALKDISPTLLEEAFRKLSQNPRITRLPLPAAVREATSPNLPERDEGIEIAQRIIAALTRHGYTWPDTCRYDGKTWPQAFIDECGEAAWLVVQRFGGFMAIHSQWCETDPSMFFAQLRDRSESTVKRARLGLIDTPPTLPMPKEDRSAINAQNGNSPMLSLSQLMNDLVNRNGNNNKTGENK